MPRESDQHGPRQDDELKKEMEDELRGTAPTDTDQWLDPDDE